MRLIILGAAALLFPCVATASAYDADLIPVRNRPEARELTGHVSISGESGDVRVDVTDVLDANGDYVDDRFVTLELRLRVNGVRRRFVLGVPVTLGDGSAHESLGLQAGSRVIVSSVKLRGPQRKLLAEAGTLTAAPDLAPTPTPPTNECPSALESCVSDLTSCVDDLTLCEESF